MSGVHYSLRPMDMALFRDGRSFDAADAHGARLLSLLPPPLTVYGCLRQTILHEVRIPYADFRSGRGTKELGVAPELPGSLALGAIVVSGIREDSDQEVRLLPLPADLVHIQSRDEDYFGYQLPADGAENTNLPHGLSLLRPQRTGAKWHFSHELDRYALNTDSLEAYLTGKPVPLRDEISSYLAREKRIGLEMDASTHTAKQGRLYSAEFVRPVSMTSYLVDILEGGDQLPKSQFPFAMGGERRPFAIERRNYPLFQRDLRDRVENALLRGKGRLSFRLYLLSPAPSKEGDNGWKPDMPPGYEIYAAAVPQPVWVSGWNTGWKPGANGPRAARPFIPSGAVYFVRSPEKIDRAQAVNEILCKFWYRPALGGGAQTMEAKAGHGLTLVGAIADEN